MMDRWRGLSITSKFSLAFGSLLLLIILVAITGYVALTLSHRQIETAILTSVRIQRLVREMDACLKEARLLERNFFLRYPKIGLSKANQTYIEANKEKVAELDVLGNDLQQIISQPEVSPSLRNSQVDLNFYRSAVNRYDEALTEAVDLVIRLATDETGLQAQLAHHADQLGELLTQANTPQLLDLYRRMEAGEKEYLLTRQRPFMQAAFNTAVRLEATMNQSTALSASKQAEAQFILQQYLATAEEILQVDVLINSKFAEFDIQSQAVDPVSEKLIALANSEVSQAQEKIKQASQLASLSLVAAVIAALILATIIALIFNNNLTRNIIRLAEATNQLQAGNLTVRANIQSQDELGQLADNFNGMARRINTLVNNLEQEVAERTAELRAANQQLHSELVLAQEIQQSLLPPAHPNWAELDVICYNSPAREVGGDFYTYHQLEPDSFALTVGDVSGKGMSAALLMATSLALFNSAKVHRYPPAQLLAHLDEALIQYTKPTRQNCALCYIEIAPNPERAATSERTLRIINAGCIPPYIKRRSGQVEWPEIGGFALGQGLGAKLGYQETHLTVTQGDMIILTSDGVVEAHNGAEAFFGFERLEQAIASGPMNDAEAMLTHLRHHLESFVDGNDPHDDVTIVVVQV